MNIFLLFLFGGLGTVCRYGTSLGAAYCFGTAYPWGTLLANLFGSVLFGIGFGLFQTNFISPQTKLLFLTGFCGGFTTFSAFAHENLVLLEQGHYAAFGFHFAAHTVLGLAAVFAGLWFAAKICPCFPAG